MSLTSLVMLANVPGWTSSMMLFVRLRERRRGCVRKEPGYSFSERKKINVFHKYSFKNTKKSTFPNMFRYDIMTFRNKREIFLLSRFLIGIALFICLPECDVRRRCC
jgi:hypothetical protein